MRSLPQKAGLKRSLRLPDTVRGRLSRRAYRERGCVQLATVHNCDPGVMFEPIAEVVLSGEFETHPPLICVSTYSDKLGGGV